MKVLFKGKKYKAVSFTYPNGTNGIVFKNKKEQIKISSNVEDIKMPIGRILQRTYRH